MGDNYSNEETAIYTEHINLNEAYKVVQNWDSIILTFSEERQIKIKNTVDNYQDPIYQLKKIVKENNNVIHTKYNFSKNLQTYGRMFSQNASLSSLPCEIRNCIANNLYYDVDMKNAHPTILSQYCNINGICCNLVDKYVADRDTIISKVCNENEISKGQAKVGILSILNGGKCETLKGDFIDAFKKEIKTIHKNICAINATEYKKICKRKDYNKEGSMMNVILCSLEHKILMNAVVFMKKEGYNVDVLVFDGFMVRKIKELTANILIRLQEYVKEHTKYDIVFVEKSMINTIDLSIYPDKVDCDEVVVSYYKDKEKFEKTHLKIIHPSIYLSYAKNGEIHAQVDTQVASSYRHLKSTVKGQKGEAMKVSFINNWMNDENIRCYDRMAFIPSPLEYDRDVFNTWADFKNTKVPLPDNFNINTNTHIKEYLQFISNLFGGQQIYIDYFLAWCANIIQRPAYRSCVCLILYSLDEGVGKNMIINTLEMCIGDLYVNYITDVANQLFGKHSSAEMNKLLIVMNEVKGKDTYANTDLFKTRITDDKREVELKGKEAFQLVNYCIYIVNTNNLSSANAGEKDRRFCVLDCNNSMINDKKYFQLYDKNINKNPEAIRCIFEYLKTYDIQKIVPDYLFSQARPKTEMYQELVESNTNKDWDFICKIVYDNKYRNDVMTISYAELWNKYKNYCSDNNYDIKMLSSKRFVYNFNRTIVITIIKKEGFEEAIVKGTSTFKRSLKLDIPLLKKYFEIDENDDDGDGDDDN